MVSVVLAHVGMASIVLAHTVMAFMTMAYVVMAPRCVSWCFDASLNSYGLNSYGLNSYGLCSYGAQVCELVLRCLPNVKSVLHFIALANGLEVDNLKARTYIVMAHIVMA